MKTTYIAQSPTPTPTMSPIQPQQPFDPGTATIWAALITAGLSSIATIISLVSNRRLMTRLEKERREHDIQMAQMQQEHETQIENARLRPERRLQFIGYWRKRLRKDTFTHKDIFNDKAYKTLAGFISPEVLQLIQQELQKTEAEKKSLKERIDFEDNALHYKNIIWENEEVAREARLAYEDYNQYIHEQQKWDDVERWLAKARQKLEEFDVALTKFVKEQLEEELRKLEKEEWELL
jgi:hypothetical protein